MSLESSLLNTVQIILRDITRINNELVSLKIVQGDIPVKCKYSCSVCIMFHSKSYLYIFFFFFFYTYKFKIELLNKFRQLKVVCIISF